MSTQDLSEQLALTAKLAAQVERMATAAERLESSYDTQIAAVQQLASAFNAINASGAVQNIEVLNKTLKDVAGQMQDTGRVTESTFRTLNKKLDESGKSFASKFPKSVAVATGALAGLRQGMSNVIALGKGFAGFAIGVVDGLTNIAGSIVAIPLKIFQGLVDLAARAAHGSTELLQALEDLRKQFGAFYAPTNKAIIGTAKSLKGFEATGLSSFRVFGNMAMRLNYMREMATEMGASFNLLRKEFEDNGGAVLAYRKGLGLTAEQMKAVSQRSDMMGNKSTKTLKDMTKYSYALADAFGLDAKVISREMGEAMKDMGHFGTTTVKSLGESVTYAHRFGLELKDITGVLDKYLSFDAAAEGAANLSQAFGANIDSFALMKASAEGDVAKSVEILRKSLRAAGVDATQFTAVDRKLIAQNTGLSDSAIQAAFSLKKQGIGLDQVQKVGDKAQKKTMTQEEAMSKLADAIERIVMSPMGMKGGFWDQWFAGIQAGIQSSGEFLGLMRNIQMALHQTYMIGVKLGRDLVKIVPGFKETLGALRDFFDPKSFAGMFQNISDTIRRFFDPKSSDRDNVPKLFDGLKKAVTDMFTREGTAGKKILEGFSTFFKTMYKISLDVLEMLSAKVASGIYTIVDLLQGKSNVAAAVASGKGGMGFMWKLIEPLVNSLKKSWKLIEPALYSLLGTLRDKMWAWVQDNKAIFTKIGLAIVGYMFAMSLAGAATAYIATLIVEAAGGLLASGAKHVLQRIGGDVLAKMFEKGSSDAVAANISKTLTESMTKVSATGLSVGEKIGEGAAASMSRGTPSIASRLAQSIGASGVGSMLGAVIGAAVVAYMAVEGKRVIDETFEKGQAADKKLREAEMQGFNATGKRATLDEKSQAIEQLKKTIAEQEKALAKENKGYGEQVIDWVAGTNIAADQAADALARSRRTLQDLQGQMNAARKTNASGVEDAQKRAQGLLKEQKFMGEVTLEDAKEKLADLDSLSKKMLGKNFDIQKTIDAIKEKFKSINFDILTPQQAQNLSTSSESLKQIDKYADTLRNVLSNLNQSTQLMSQLAVNSTQMPQNVKTAKNNVAASVEAVKSMQQAFASVDVEGMQKFSVSVNKVSDVIKGGEQGGIVGALNAVKQMVKVANDLDKALADGNVNKIDIKARLERVAKAVGLGGKATYTVDTGKNVVITVNMQVYMSASEVEKAIIFNKSSIIADRLNFATNRPTERGADIITRDVEPMYPLDKTSA